MSILTAIFQAIGQALTWVLPVSESGHSAIFHDFSGRYTNACSQLTGIIHIGIAIGIFIAFYRLFFGLFKNFFAGFNDLFHKRLDVKGASPQRRFMYMTILSLAFFVFYLIPSGAHGNLFMLFHRTSFNGNLIGEGICMALTGALIIASCALVNKTSGKIPYILQAVILGITAFLALPFAGCSFMGGILFVGIIVGMSEKSALRYSAAMSVPVLITAGIIELCIGVTKLSAVSAIIALIISVLISFFAVKILIYVIKNKSIKYFAVYDAVIGIICFVIGVFESVVK